MTTPNPDTDSAWSHIVDRVHDLGDASDPVMDAGDIAADAYLLGIERGTIRGTEQAGPRPLWKPAIPQPLRGLRKQCLCGRRYWTMAGYRGHYALAHLLTGARVTTWAALAADPEGPRT